MISSIIGLLLSGQLSSEYGRIGILVNHQTHGIIKVYRVSPAQEAGIQRGDTILECDGVKGHDIVDGSAGSFAYITIKRNDQILKFIVKRVPSNEVHN